ncbi:MAG TPA: DUF4255 domain-containing protein [Acidimicrobiales bacterium]|jgi:hypothetical protein
MSNSLAVATVTAAIRQLLGTAPNGFPGLNVTTKPPDRARVGESGNQLNVFLYNLGPDAAWRNAELPKDRTGAAGFFPPVALTLDYLLTAYAADDDEIQAQTLLLWAVSVLHDSAVLDRSLLQNALTGTDLHLQPDRVRITLSTLPLDDLSKLWTAFQSGLRLSAAYTASVVLIDSATTRPSPLPVLRRGQDDQGVLSQVGIPASLHGVHPDVGVPGVLVSARLGDTLIVEGAGLSADHQLRFRHASAGLVTLAPEAGSTTNTLAVKLPDASGDPTAWRPWAPGVYMVSAVRTDADGREVTTNEVPLPLAPLITVSPPAHAPGDFSLTVTCLPQVRDGQSVVLVFGENRLPVSLTSNAGTDNPTELSIALTGIQAGSYVVRVRVDDVVDSLPIASAPGTPLTAAFDPGQQVSVS